MHKTFATLKKDSPLKSSAFHNFSCWIKCIGLVNDNFELWFTTQFSVICHNTVLQKPVQHIPLLCYIKGGCNVVLATVFALLLWGIKHQAYISILFHKNLHTTNTSQLTKLSIVYFIFPHQLSAWLSSFQFFQIRKFLTWNRYSQVNMTIHRFTLWSLEG